MPTEGRAYAPPRRLNPRNLHKFGWCAFGYEILAAGDALGAQRTKGSRAYPKIITGKNWTTASR